MPKILVDATDLKIGFRGYLRAIHPDLDMAERHRHWKEFWNALRTRPSLELFLQMNKESVTNPTGEKREPT